jgi:hypothetical protein
MKFLIKQQEQKDIANDNSLSADWLCYDENDDCELISLLA